ncbi:MAG: metallophosphoesterase family protein [Actinobacteria bacterium]|nr:metallophosphoesterase family protein [Actinomycetota bacterium]
MAVLSDIHGNLPAFEAVLRDLPRVAPDSVVFAGDVALFGSQPRACWEHVRAAGWRTVQGNTDRYIADLEGKLASLAPEQAGLRAFLQTNVAWAREDLGADGVTALAAMGRSVEVASAAGRTLIVHGVPGDDETGLARHESDHELARKLGAPEAAVVVCGHTHTAFVRHVGATLVVNGGAVGRPHDGLPGQATYAVLDDSSGRWSATIRRTAFDPRVELDALRVRGAPVPAGFAETLLTGRAPVWKP